MNKLYKYLKVNYFNKNRTFIIAEIGTNHNQNINLAKKLIIKAKKSGADAVKFQILNFEEQYFSKDYSKKFAEFFKKIEFKNYWLEKLNNFCRKKKIIFFATPTYKRSALQLIKKNILIKIASPQFATDEYLIDIITKSKKASIISNGLLNLEQTIKKIKKIYSINKNIILLYCISRYPTKINDLNLINIEYLKKKLPCPIGFSDHSTSIDVPVYAVSRGAQVIEKHITLNKKFKGPDHAFALEIEEFRLMVQKIREYEKSIGKVGKNLNSKEKKMIKELTPKLIVKNKIKKNEKINMNSICLKRSKSGLKYFKDLKKYKAKKDLEKNEAILKKNLKLN